MLEACIRWGDAHWRHLANNIAPSTCGGDAAFLSNYFHHLLFVVTVGFPSKKIFLVLHYCSNTYINRFQIIQSDRRRRVSLQQMSYTFKTQLVRNVNLTCSTNKFKCLDARVSMMLLLWRHLNMCITIKSFCSPISSVLLLATALDFIGCFAVLRMYMRPNVTDGVAWSVCRSVCLSRSWAVQKRLNRSRCRLGCWLLNLVGPMNRVLSLYGVRIDATWRIRLNRLCAAAMRPFLSNYFDQLLFFFTRLLVIAALRSRCGHYIFILWFLLSFFLSSCFFLA